MKKTLVFCLLLMSALFISVLIHAQAESQVGRLQGGKPVITMPAKALIACFSANLREYSGINAAFTKVDVVANGADYFLQFSGKTYVSNLRLSLTDDGLLLAGYSACTTKDCQPGGCLPNAGDACAPCSTGTCTKTTATVPLVGNCGK